MQNARLDETQVGIKIAGINNLRYADDTTLMTESKELKNLLMKVKEEMFYFLHPDVIQLSHALVFLYYHRLLPHLILVPADLIL